MSANTYYLAQFLHDSTKADYGISQLVPEDIKPQNKSVSEVTAPLIDSFARIYYSSDGFDLGTPPKLGAGRSYELDAIIAAAYAVLSLVGLKTSIETRARAVHDALSHNYLEWFTMGKASGRHHLIVPFESLSPYEKKKRYFAAEVVMHLAANDERFIAGQMLDLATYHVAYDILRAGTDPVPEPDVLIEAYEGDNLSASTLH